MAGVEQHRTSYRVRIRMPDGTVGVDSSHPTRAAAEIRCKQVDVERALETYIDPARGRITLDECAAIWETGHLAGPAKWASVYPASHRQSVQAVLPHTACRRRSPAGMRALILAGREAIAPVIRPRGSLR
jgi:hypothetical protein